MANWRREEYLKMSNEVEAARADGYLDRARNEMEYTDDDLRDVRKLVVVLRRAEELRQFDRARSEQLKQQAAIKDSFKG